MTKPPRNPIGYWVFPLEDGEGWEWAMARVSDEYFDAYKVRPDLMLVPFDSGIELSMWLVRQQQVKVMPSSSAKTRTIWVGMQVNFRPIEVQLRDPLQRERVDHLPAPTDPFQYPAPIVQDSWGRVQGDMANIRPPALDRFIGAPSYLTAESRAFVMTKQEQHARGDLMIEFAEANPTLSMRELRNKFMDLYPDIAPLTRGSFASILNRARARKLKESGKKNQPTDNL